MLRVDVKPELLRWARERADASVEELSAKFPKLEAWERGEGKPTLKQLEEYARVTAAPFGYFFASAPPDEPIPIPDFRTVGGKRIARLSGNLLDTIYLCQQRQYWYSDYATAAGDVRLAFVGSATIRSAIEPTADDMRRVLGFDVEARSRCATWTDALRMFVELADAAGVLVMCSGVVLNNTSRKLDPQEFRGFALADDLAPLVFINGADTKAAQMFTLAHELAHVWLGQSALSDVDAATPSKDAIERWCNDVAAELLVPMSVLRGELRRDELLGAEMQRLARHFKVSSLVILRRVRDAQRITDAQFHAAYEAELQRIRELPRGSGGNFYLTQTARVSRRFARALIESTLEGITLQRDAYRMLGVKKTKTFDEYARSLGYAV